MIFLSTVLPLLSGQNYQLVLVKSFPDINSNIENNYLINPYEVRIYKDYYVVSDSKANCLKIFTRNGDFVRKIGKKGQGPGDLLDPFVVAVDEKTGMIYCGDQGNSRISCFSFDGELKNIIKTSLSIWDMESFNGLIYAEAYNETKQSLFSLYNNEGTLIKSFGTFFDKRINGLPYDYKKVLYREVYLKIEKELLYVFYERLPYISVYDLDGQLIRQINIRDKQIENVYTKNRAAYVNRKDAFMGLAKWMNGGCVEDDRIYCYSPYAIGKMLVFDKNGNLLNKIPFKDKMSSIELMKKRFVTKNGKDFIFIDSANSQIQIYELIM
jgi:hypothetical protein